MNSYGWAKQGDTNLVVDLLSVLENDHQGLHRGSLPFYCFLDCGNVDSDLNFAIGGVRTNGVRLYEGYKVLEFCDDGLRSLHVFRDAERL